MYLIGNNSHNYWSTCRTSNTDSNNSRSDVVCYADRKDNGNSTTGSRTELLDRWNRLYQYNRSVQWCSTGNIQRDSEECSRMYLNCSNCDDQRSTDSPCSTNSEYN